MPKPGFHGPLVQLSNCCWKIPRSYKPGMRVDGLIYASAELIEHVRADQAPEQVANVATLPGIQVASLAMPDIHWGYGFTIGGVCATDPNDGGVISPGGVGYDINCGVRLIRSNLFLQDVKPHLNRLVDELFKQVPTGVGRSGKYRFDKPELRELMAEGVSYLQRRGLATDADIEFTEAHGRLDGAVLGPDAFVLRFLIDDANDRLLLVNFGRELRLREAPEPLLAPPENRTWSVLWSSEKDRKSVV